MNKASAFGAAIASIAMFFPARAGIVMWLFGISLFSFGRGIASGERWMRHTSRGGDR